jgi:hypothetical protein
MNKHVSCWLLILALFINAHSDAISFPVKEQILFSLKNNVGTFWRFMTPKKIGLAAVTCAGLCGLYYYLKNYYFKNFRTNKMIESAENLKLQKNRNLNPGRIYKNKDDDEINEIIKESIDLLGMPENPKSL